jgi:hypothetical protein
MAGAFLGLGVILHAFFYWLDPEKFDARAFRTAGIGMLILLAGLCGLSVVLSRATNLPSEVLSSRFNAVLSSIGAWLLSLVVSLLTLSFGLLYIRVRFHPANRIARRLQAGDLAGAIRLGEARLPRNRDFATNLNLASAYALSGQTEKALELLPALEQQCGVPPCSTAESHKQALNGLRQLIDRGPLVHSPVAPNAAQEGRKGDIQSDLEGGAAE